MEPFLAHSATKLGGAAGRVLVCGSHGGRYAGLLCLASGVRAVVLNDAGIGLEGAGIGCLEVCERAGVPAATAAHTSCRIGHAGSTLDHGVVSHCNAPAAALGVLVGQPVRSAARLLTEARNAAPHDVAGGEHRSARIGTRGRLVIMDSNALVRPGEDDGAVLITGSHGGLVGDDPASAGRANARLFAYNDAGVGLDNAGISRLPALEARGIAAVTVSHETARIGEGASTLKTGVISHANAPAAATGARPGTPLREVVDDLVG